MTKRAEDMTLEEYLEEARITWNAIQLAKAADLRIERSSFRRAVEEAGQVVRSVGHSRDVISDDGNE